MFFGGGRRRTQRYARRNLIGNVIGSIVFTAFCLIFAIVITIVFAVYLNGWWYFIAATWIFLLVDVIFTILNIVRLCILYKRIQEQGGDTGAQFVGGNNPNQTFNQMGQPQLVQGQYAQPHTQVVMPPQGQYIPQGPVMQPQMMQGQPGVNPAFVQQQGFVQQQVPMNDMPQPVFQPPVQHPNVQQVDVKKDEDAIVYHQ